MKKVLSLLLLLLCFTLVFTACGKDADSTATTASATTAAPATTATPDTTSAPDTTATPGSTAEPATTAAPVVEPQTVTVTIVNKSGSVVLVMAEIETDDLDGDGTVTIYDALKAAHATCPAGVDGFATAVGNYGPFITKLWGEENNGSFGYYQNEASAWSLTDPVRTGDRIVAYAYTDAEFYSDVFSYFAPQTETKNEGESVTLTLTALIPDADWNPVPTPVAGAKIFVNGTETAFTTDAEGKVTLTLEKGVNLVTAKGDGIILVTPVAKIEIK